MLSLNSKFNMKLTAERALRDYHQTDVSTTMFIKQNVGKLWHSLKVGSLYQHSQESKRFETRYNSNKQSSSKITKKAQ